jgi:pimeloyl-ACP methyl ester carboxylesterase
MSALETVRISTEFGGQEIGVSALVADTQSDWIVALHGIQSNKELYEPLLSQPFATEYSQLAIDFVGFGGSDKPESFSYSAEDQAQIVRQVLGHFAIERLHLIGHSLGGMVGTLLLPQLGSRVLSFANLEGNLVGADCGASKDTIQFSIEEFVSAKYDWMRERIAQSQEPSAALRRKWLEAIPAEVFYKTSASIVDLSNSERLQTIFNDTNVRRLFMYGSKNARKAAEVSDSVEKVEIPDAGHYMLLDQPQACFAALRKLIVG